MMDRDSFDNEPLTDPVHLRMLHDLHIILDRSRQPLERLGRWTLGKHCLFGHTHISAYDEKSRCWIVERLDNVLNTVYAIGPELPLQHCASWTQARLLVLISGAAAEVPGDHDILPYRLELSPRR